jgi:diguanylate cyclase (GGDEF)-like protein
VKLMRAAPLPPSILVELVGLLFSAAAPLALIGVAYAAVGGMAMSKDDDPISTVLAFAGIALTAVRLLLVSQFRRITRGRALGAVEARRWERAFGAGSMAFALCIGCLGARSLAFADAELQMMAIALLCGYAAGQAARVSIRPWICIPSLMLAALPIIAALAWRGGVDDLVLAGFLLFFLLASFETVAYGYRTALTLIANRQQIAALARSDPLTGLPNRLALWETVDAAILNCKAEGRLVAVHCVDLDRFKPVNDRYGHPVGDALLKAVAGRLAGAIRPGDLAVRTGGDEFVLVQMGVADTAAAEMLARRIVRALNAPFAIEGYDIRIGGSVGVALAPKDGSTLEELMDRADKALYLAKGRGRDGFRFFDKGDEAVASDALVAAWRRKEPA